MKICVGTWLIASMLWTPKILVAKIYQSFANVAEKAIPGVVNIRTTQYISGRTSMTDPYQFFLKGRLPKSSKNHSLGSGVIMNNKGYIVTNYHVVRGASKIEILFAKSKKKIQAVVVGSDKKTDVALLKVAGNRHLKYLEFGDSRKLRVGDVVLAIGNPFGFAHTVTSGIISAKGRVLGTGPYDRFLQTDAPIHPGNSGGPLIDIRGRVIGINSAIRADGPGIGFAIPANLVKQVVAELIKHGKVIRPWLGIVGKNILSRDEIGDSYDPAGVHGVMVENLIVDGPSYAAGLQVGDLILAVDSEKVYDLNHLQRKLDIKKPSDSVRLKLYRRNQGVVHKIISLRESPRTQDLPEEKDLF